MSGLKGTPILDLISIPLYILVLRQIRNTFAIDKILLVRNVEGFDWTKLSKTGWSWGNILACLWIKWNVEKQRPWTLLNIIFAPTLYRGQACIKYVDWSLSIGFEENKSVQHNHTGTIRDSRNYCIKFTNNHLTETNLRRI